MIALIALIALCSFVASCGSGRTGTGDDGASLETVLAEVYALEAPAGVDTSLFAELKASLASALQQTGKARFTSAVPSGAAGQVSDLAFSGEQLRWTYVNRGDYDQNSEVNGADIAPIAAHFRKNTASPDWLSKAVAVDGDANGEINGADIVPIAGNFRGHVEGYRIEVSADGEDGWSDLNDVPFSAATASGAFLTFEVAPESLVADSWYRVVPFSGSELGAPSNAVQYLQSVIVAPEIAVIAPGGGIENSVLQFSAVIEGGSPDSYLWNFGTGASPSIAQSGSPTVTLGSQGVYNGQLTVVNQAGTDVFDFTYEIGPIGVGPQIVSVYPRKGDPGQVVKFFPVLKGSTPIAYIWDFGGGASPNGSTEKQPQVVLAQEGFYQCQLTVINGQGQASFDFSLTVGSPLIPPSIESIAPVSGTTGDVVAFQAEITGGLADTFTWVFGGGADPNVSTESEPTVTLAMPGTYNASIIVGNSAGSDSFDFLLTVFDIGIPPQVVSVQPLSGTAGQAVTFTANISGGAPEGYLWDFGGGAQPNTSTLNEPSVTLGGAGTYPASLTVSNASGQDTFNYDLTVNPSLGPKVESVTPLQGNANESVTFSVELSGSVPDTFDWQFGGGAVPDQSSDESPTVELTEPGEYSASVTVSNGDGLDVFPFLLTVHGWRIITIVSQGGLSGTSLAVIGDKPAIAFNDGANVVIKYTRSDTATGASSTDWSAPSTVDSVGSTNAGLWELEPVQGNPAVCYTVSVGADYNLKYAYSSTQDGADTDWIPVTVDSSASVGLFASLEVIEGNPAISYRGPGDLKYARSTSVTGSQPSDWSQIVTVDSVGDVGSYTSLAVVSGTPAISYVHLQNTEVRFARSSTPTGSSSSDWSQIVVIADVNSDSGILTSLRLVNGNPAVAHMDHLGNLIYRRSTTATGASPTDWQNGINVVNGMLGNLAVVGGLPKVSYGAATNLWLASSETSNGDDFGDWSVEIVDDGDGNSVGQSSSLAEVDGRAAVSYIDITDGSLKYAILF